jgi:hypothetical protein
VGGGSDQRRTGGGNGCRCAEVAGSGGFGVEVGVVVDDGRNGGKERSKRGWLRGKSERQRWTSSYVALERWVGEGTYVVVVVVVHGGITSWGRSWQALGRRCRQLVAGLE